MCGRIPNRYEVDVWTCMALFVALIPGASGSCRRQSNRLFLQPLSNPLNHLPRRTELSCMHACPPAHFAERTFLTLWMSFPGSLCKKVHCSNIDLDGRTCGNRAVRPSSLRSKFTLSRNSNGRKQRFAVEPISPAHRLIGPSFQRVHNHCTAGSITVVRQGP